MIHPRANFLELAFGHQAWADLGAPVGPPLLLVHGWGGDSRSWAPLAAQLTSAYRVLTVDVRGHGCSSRPPAGVHEFDPEAIAEDLVAVLDAADVERVVAVGHSWGGQLVTALAVTHPERVERLVALDPAYGATSEADLSAMYDRWRSAEARTELRRFAESAFGPDTPADVREQVHAGFRDTDLRVLADAFAAMYLTERSFGLWPATAAYLSRVGAPTLSVYSGEAAARRGRDLPAPAGSQVVAYTGVGHYLHQERPAELAKLLMTWLAETGRPG